jgi:hypothetical protein
MGSSTPAAPRQLTHGKFSLFKFVHGRSRSIDEHHVVATTVAADRDEALWFSEKLRLMSSFEGDPVAAEFLLGELPENLPYRTWAGQYNAYQS